MASTSLRILLVSSFVFGLELSASAQAPAQQNAQQAAQQPTGGAAAKGARDLSVAEACDLVIELFKGGELTLLKHHPMRGAPPMDASKVTKCRDILFPGTKQIVRLAFPLKGVDYYYYGREKDTGSKDSYRFVDVRLAVMLYRLSKMLNEKYGAKGLYHNGVGTGNPATAHTSSFHHSARMLDLGRLSGNTQGADYEIRVLRDWGEQPEKKVNNKRVYRLEANPSDRQKDLAYKIFLDVYRFCAAECTDTREKAGTNIAPLDDSGSPAERVPGDLPAQKPATLKTSYGYILHPDHASDKLSKDHKNHYHIQVGPSGAEQKPAAPSGAEQK